MTYEKNGIKIAVYQLDGFGKMPSLWIGADHTNVMRKVASFRSENSARKFEEVLEYMFGTITDDDEIRRLMG